MVKFYEQFLYNILVIFVWSDKKLQQLVLVNMYFESNHCLENIKRTTKFDKFTQKNTIFLESRESHTYTFYIIPLRASQSTVE